MAQHVIKCPNCGESNLPDQEFCQYCQARLQPLTGKLKGADKPLTPGDLPTKKNNTAELEPILPQWLREARDSARQTSEEDTAQAAQQKPEASRPAASGSDLLAGLQSQAQDNDEEDTPDWLANITGQKPKAKKPKSESSEVRWVELGDTNDFAQSEPASDTPSWLQGLTSSTPRTEENDELTAWMRGADNSQNQQPSQPTSFNTPPSSVPSSAGETPDWLQSMAADGGAFTDSDNTTSEPLISSDDTPDWLRAMDTQSPSQSPKAPLSTSAESSAFSEAPDWLHTTDTKNAAPSQGNLDSSDADVPNWLHTPDAKNAAPNTGNSGSSDADVPDWLRTMDAESAPQNPKAPLGGSGSSSAFSEAPDWLRATDAENAAQTPLSNAGSFDTPDWLRAMDSESAPQSPKAPLSNLGPLSDSSETPDWLRAINAEDKASAGSSKTGPATSDANEVSPDWLKGLDTSGSSSDLDWMKGIQSGENQQPVQDSDLAWLSAASIPSAPEPNQPFATTEDDSDVPSWLKAAAPKSSIYDESPVPPMPVQATPSSDTPDWLDTLQSVDTPEPQAIPESPASSMPPAFSEPLANEDALFTEMPDWLSAAADSSSPESIPAPIKNGDTIAPGELPSWVQAMRPVDTGASQAPSTALSDDKTLESRGALAGLQGVLPAVQGFSPTSKPKAYSIKLRASEEQQAHAALLEKILAAETAPVPIGSLFALGPSRVLRGLLTLLLIAGLATILFMRTAIFSMPVGLPLEVADSLNVIRSVPEGAPVLVAFDYEPARVGEMEAAAVPVLDQMLILRHPHMAFISTNETGAILAERFMAGPLAGYNYQSGSQYLNLGYLPNGPTGIRAFVQDPRVTTQFAIAGNPALLNFGLTPAWTSDPWKGITSLSQFAAIIIVTDNADSARAWIEQTTSAPNPIPAIPFVVVSSAQAAPIIQPYYVSRQINGLVSGLYGGALVEQNNAGRPGTARTYWDAYSIGMLVAVVLILGGGLLNLILGIRDRAAAKGTN